MSKFKVGDKVVPHSKSRLCRLEECEYWRKATQIGQPYLYITTIHTDGDISVCVDNVSGVGNLYLEEDLTLYQEPSTTTELTELPENWCIKVTRNQTNHPEIREWRNMDWYDEGYIHKTGDWSRVIANEYLEITTEQFKKWVLKGDTVKPKFKVGKWYQSSVWSTKQDYAKSTEFARNTIYFDECIHQGKYAKGSDDWIMADENLREVPLEEIQEYLPDGHPDRFDTVKVPKTTEPMELTKDTVKEGMYVKIIDDAVGTNNSKGDIGIIKEVRDCTARVTVPNKRDSGNLSTYGCLKLSTKEAYDAQHGITAKSTAEKWNVGSYIVNIDGRWRSSQEDLTPGKVYEVVDKAHATSYILDNAGTKINFTHAEVGQGLEWFATKQEADDFARTLITAEAPQAETNLEKAKRLYPVGTIVRDAINQDVETIETEPQLRNDGVVFSWTADKKLRTFIFYNQRWAEIVQQEKPVKKPVATEKPWVPSVGDYITITKSEINWNSKMDKFDGKTYKVQQVLAEGRGRITFAEGESWKWFYAQKHFRQATPEEILSVTSSQPTSTITIAPEQEGEVVHCTTQEEWDTVLSVFNPIPQRSEDWIKGKCINLKTGRTCNIEWYKKENYYIISFQEWCTINSINPVGGVSVENETFPKASKVEGYTVDNSNPLFPKIKLK